MVEQGRQHGRHSKRMPGWEPLETRTLCAVTYPAQFYPEDPRTVVFDLGNVTSVVAHGGAWASAAISPDETIDFRMSLSLSANYLLWCRYTGDAVSLSYSGPNGEATITPGASGTVKFFHLSLQPGEYTFTAEATGEAPAFVDWDLLLANGLGQGPAQLTPMIALAPTGVVGTQVAPSPAAPTSGASATGGLTATSATALPPVQGAMWAGLISDRGLVGRPSSDTEHVAVVGTTTPNGTSSTASLTAIPLDSGLRSRQTADHEEPFAAPINGAMPFRPELARYWNDEDVLAAVENVQQTTTFLLNRLQGLMLAAEELKPDGPTAVSDLPEVVDKTTDASGKEASNARLAAWLLPLPAVVAVGYRFRSRRKDRPDRSPVSSTWGRTMSRRAGNLPRWQRNSMLKSRAWRSD